MNRVISTSLNSSIGVTGPGGRSRADSSGIKTAKKVSEIPVPMIRQAAGLGKRDAILLKDVRDLYKKIFNDWNALAPDELAEKISVLEDKVMLFKEETAPIKKIIHLVGQLRVRLALPSSMEAYVRPSEESMPDTVATTLLKIKKQILKMNSLKPLEQLNSVQRFEISRHLVGG